MLFGTIPIEPNRISKGRQHMLTRDEAVVRLNISPLTLQILVQDGMILELNGTGESLYPEEQFSERGLNGKFASFLGLFRNLTIDGDTIWSWLNSPLDILEHRTPLSHLIQAETDETMERFRFVAASEWAIRAMDDPSIQRTDWLRSASDVDPTGVGDYTPKRRGGQHAS